MKIGKLDLELKLEEEEEEEEKKITRLMKQTHFFLFILLFSLLLFKQLNSLKISKTFLELM